MKTFSYSLVGDGPTDARLIHIIDWAIRQHSAIRFTSSWVDIAIAPDKPVGLAGRIKVALDYYPSDILVVHRDAEGETIQKRDEEIADALASLNHPPYIGIVPVRMQEAWLLFDEQAIRRAAGNPRGTVPLGLPALNAHDRVADPKAALHAALRTASELTGRKLEKFSSYEAIDQVAVGIGSFAELRRFPAFVTFEHRLSTTLKATGLT